MGSDILTEIIADILIDIFTAESTLVRVHNNRETEAHFDLIDKIAKVLTSEMSTRIISKASTGFNRIFSGQMPNHIKEKLNTLRLKMTLSMDIIAMKRSIAEGVCKINEYPF